MKWSIAALTRPRAGESENGDCPVVLESAGVTWVGIIDVLGHGSGAAKVAALSMQKLEAAPRGDGIEPMMRGLHQGLAGTRGAAAILCRLEGDALAGCGVGNVFFHCGPTRVPSIIGEGVLGVRLRRLRSFTSKLNRADRIVLTSDGIGQNFSVSDFRDLSPNETCSEIIMRHGIAHDDATVVVVDADGEVE